MNKIFAKASEIPVAVDCPIRNIAPHLDFEEAFTRTLPVLDPSLSPADLIEKMKRETPSFFLIGLQLRDLCLVPFGFSPVTWDHFEWTDIDSDTRIGEFKDKPFTAYIGLSIKRPQKAVILSCGVVFHNSRGQCYMSLIKPLHKRVFKFLLNKL